MHSTPQIHNIYIHQYTNAHTTTSTIIRFTLGLTQPQRGSHSASFRAHLEAGVDLGKGDCDAKVLRSIGIDKAAGFLPPNAGRPAPRGRAPPQEDHPVGRKRGVISDALIPDTISPDN
eukprot:737540-Prorocentrum_minimum.AAC.1